MVPDGGWGWLVVFASFMIHAIADGVAYTFGLFYSELVIYFSSSKGVAAWVPSIMTGMTLIIGPVAASLTTRYGCRKITILGSILAAFGLASSVLASSIYFLFITIGFTAGAGFGLIYLPAIVCVTCYFEKRRAFATGLAVAGAGIGSAVFAPLIDFLISNLKWRGAMLVISLIVLSCALFGCLFRPLAVERDDDYEEEEDEFDNETCESGQLNDSVTNISTAGRVQRFSLDTNAKFNRQHSTDNKLKHGNTLQPYTAASSNYLKPKTICYSPSVLSLPHYKSSPALFAVDSIVVRSNSTFGSKVASHSVKILNTKANDECNNCQVDNITHKMLDNPQMYSDANLNDVVIISSGDCDSDTSYLTLLIKFFTDFEILKNQIFVIFAVSNLATSLGFYVPHIYIKDKVKSYNYINAVDVNGDVVTGEIITDSDAANLIGMIGIGSTVGRLLFGYLSDQDYINRLWLYIMCVTASGASVITYAFISSYSMLAVCSVTYGLTGGGYVSLTSVLIVDLLGLEKLTSAFGILLLFQGVASLTGPPAIGVIYDLTNSYDIGFTLAGILIVISGLMLVPVGLMKEKKLPIDDTVETCQEKSDCQPTPLPTILISGD